MNKINFLGVKNIDDLLRIASDSEITDEMREFFKTRTKKHIDLVKKYCKRLHEYDSGKFEGILERGEIHDQSKYEDPEIDPYILISWDYHCKDTGEKCDLSKETRDKMNEASEHHVKNNFHHPEYHSNSKEDSTINREDRDAIPDKMIDATAMSDLDIGEMCTDWAAMSEEKGTNTPQGWAGKNINKRWKFNKDQEYLIYDILDNIWDK